MILFMLINNQLHNAQNLFQLRKRVTLYVYIRHLIFQLQKQPNLPRSNATPYRKKHIIVLFIINSLQDRAVR